jgi:hypothetical protein
MLRRAVLLSFVALVAVAGTASGAEPLKRYSVGDGASLAVPASWVSLSGRQLRTRSLLDRLARENPRLAPFIAAFVQSGSSVRFMALDPRVRGGFATNVNVVSVPVSGAVTFEQYRTALLSEVRAVTQGAKVTDSVVQIGGEASLRLSYRLRLSAGGKAYTVQTLQYAFLRRGKSLVVTYTTLPRYAGTYATTFKASAQSIRFRA